MTTGDTPGRDDSASDEAIMLAVQSGDLSEFQELVKRHERNLYNFLVRYTGDRHLAEDLFQDTFVRIIEKCAHYDPARGFRAWMFAIAANLARDACRRREVRSRDLSGQVHSPYPPAGPDEEAGRSEEAQIVRHLLSELPADARAMVLMHFYHGLRYREIAEAMSVPLGTVKSRMHWAVGRLAKLWTEGSVNVLAGFTSAVRKG
jgi:RNA polymerase sigma-70 factor (ECF subfamily)